MDPPKGRRLRRPIGGSRLSRTIGELLRSAGTTDIVDASLVAIARDGDEVATSDAVDIRHLASASGKRLAILAV